MKKLNVLERIVLMGILPANASYASYKIITELKAELSFSEKELKKFGIKDVSDPKTGQGRTVWNVSANNEYKDINVGEKAKEIIVAELEKLDKEGKINQDNISLYEKFVKPLKIE